MKIGLRHDALRAAAVVVLVTGAVLSGTVASEQEATAGRIVLLSAVDDEPLDVTALQGKPATPELAEFLAHGRNGYAGRAGALAAGREKYEQWCQSCHLADASGRMGPSLVDDVYNYERTHTDVGMFEVIYGGAAGAMQSFADRLSPEEILQVIAYVRSLKKSP